MRVRAVSLVLVLVAACVTGTSETTLPSTAPTSSPVTTSTAPVDIETLRIGTSLPLTSLDTADADLPQDWQLLANIGLGLMAFAPGTAQVVAGAADSFEVSDDGLTYSFHLRPGLAFGDGTELNATLYARHVERLLTLDGAVGQALGEPFVSAVETTDPGTVTLRLVQPTAYLPALVAGVPYSPSHPSLPADGLVPLPDPPVLGIGPWMITSYDSDGGAVLEPNPRFAGDPPFFDRIVVQRFETESEAVEALGSGMVDLVWPVTQSVAELPSDVMGFPTGGGPTRFLILNHGLEPTSSVDVRRALAAAADREALVAELAGPAQALSSPIPPGFFGAENLSFGGSAVELLTAAGYTPDSPLEVALDHPSDRYGPNADPAVAALVAQWEATGLIDVETRPAAWEVFLSRLLGGDDIAVALFGWTVDYFDPHAFIEPFVTLGGLGTMVTDPETGSATDGLSRPELVNLVSEAGREHDQDRREELYRQIQQLWADDVVTIPLWWEPAWVYYRDGLVVDGGAPGPEALNIGPTQILDYAALRRG